MSCYGFAMFCYDMLCFLLCNAMILLCSAKRVDTRSLRFLRQAQDRQGRLWSAPTVLPLSLRGEVVVRFRTPKPVRFCVSPSHRPSVRRFPIHNLLFL